jgi:hypothetical protein
MNIQELKTLLQNKLRNLNDKKSAVFTNGDINLYDIYSKEIEETQEILNKLDS